MVYEHPLGCFIFKDPSSGLLELFQVFIIVTRGGIPTLVALMLGVVDCWQWQRTLEVFVLLP